MFHRFYFNPATCTFQGRLLTYEVVTGESPGEDEESPPADEICLQKEVTREAFFVNFLRTDEYDEDGVRAISKKLSIRKNEGDRFVLDFPLSFFPSGALHCLSGGGRTLRPQTYASVNLGFLFLVTLFSCAPHTKGSCPSSPEGVRRGSELA